MNKTVVVMAAGLGTRYGGLKQLDIVGPTNETIIDYSMYDAYKAGFTKVVFIIREDFKQEFIEKIGSKYENLMQVNYANQSLADTPIIIKDIANIRTKPWGTGHALLAARHVLEDPFLIINADDYYGTNAFKAASDYMENMKASQMEASMIGYTLANTLSEYGSVARGICSINSEGILEDIEETLGIHRNETGSVVSQEGKILDEQGMVSMNMWLLTPPCLKLGSSYFEDFLGEEENLKKKEFYLPTLVKRLIDEQGLVLPVLHSPDQWFGVTYREDKPIVKSHIKKLIDQNIYPYKLWD
ncbi:nucleotidyltransferase family protein [Spirochaeta cellobiosiphila]|uniref:nucleotidyltransferase family protein n=1 Tax=Spirochaeta cellobiosiphila TaxID=504483 RepID=UPI0003FBB221|nr:sugar phosphate nucleotidyltransferase [Spirochaeta cellobiosiphila]